MRVRVVAIALAVAAAVAPLAARERDPQYPPFPTEEYASFAVGGPGSLRGQAFLTTVGGAVKPAAGAEVTLDPVTPYSAVWWKHAGSDWREKKAMPPDGRFRHARRVTTADADGRFVFANLAPGRYFVRSVVTWSAGNAGIQGGIVAAIAEVVESGVSTVVVSSVPDRGGFRGWDPDLGLTDGRSPEDMAGVAVWDQRPEGARGVPVTEVRGLLGRILRSRGLSYTAVEAAPVVDRSELVEKLRATGGMRLFLLELKQWEVAQALHYSMTLNVFDTAGRAVAAATASGEAPADSQSITKVAAPILEGLLEEVLAKKAVMVEAPKPPVCTVDQIIQMQGAGLSVDQIKAACGGLMR